MKSYAMIIGRLGGLA